MAARGSLYRVARGVYVPASGSSSEHFDYEIAAKVAPSGVFTLLSALRIHGLTDENPQQMTMAIPARAHAPKSTLPMEFVYMKPKLLERDVEVMSPHGSEFRVFSVERTIVECFFARLGRVMSACRMSRVMAPYVEGLA